MLNILDRRCILYKIPRNISCIDYIPKDEDILVKGTYKELSSIIEEYKNNLEYKLYGKLVYESIIPRY